MTPPPSPAPPAIACPTDWVQGATTAKCYRKVAGAFTHKECAVQCGEGSLVCIGSQAENDLLFNDLFTIDGISWIGLYQESASADSTDSWTWSRLRLHVRKLIQWLAERLLRGWVAELRACGRSNPPDVGRWQLRKPRRVHLRVPVQHHQRLQRED